MNEERAEEIENYRQEIADLGLERDEHIDNLALTVAEINELKDELGLLLEAEKKEIAENYGKSLKTSQPCVRQLGAKCQVNTPRAIVCSVIPCRI